MLSVSRRNSEIYDRMVFYRDFVVKENIRVSFL